MILYVLILYRVSFPTFAHNHHEEGGGGEVVGCPCGCMMVRGCEWVEVEVAEPMADSVPSIVPQ